MDERCANQLQANLSYDANDVFLNLTAALGLGGGLNQNQRNVAGAINNFFNNGGALPPNFLPLFGLSGTNLANALSQLSGEAATGAQYGAFQLGNQFFSLMLDPLVYRNGGFGGVGGAGVVIPGGGAICRRRRLPYLAGHDGGCGAGWRVYQLGACERAGGRQFPCSCDDHTIDVG